MLMEEIVGEVASGGGVDEAEGVGEGMLQGRRVRKILRLRGTGKKPIRGRGQIITGETSGRRRWRGVAFLGKSTEIAHINEAS